MATSLNLVDKPDSRKQHIGAVPLVGGIVIYLTILITALVLGKKSIQLYCYLAAAGALVITGALDDRYDISAKIRLLIEFIAALIMIFFAGVYVYNLGDLFGRGDIILPTVIAVPFTVLAVAGYINAVNMSDGIDGMAACLSILAVITLMILVGGRQAFILPSITLAAALLGFLIFNLQMVRRLRKVFLGDAGSMLLGFTFAWLVIEYSQNDASGAEIFSPITALFVLGLPLVDMLTTIARRIKKGQNPMRPDRTHVHHILLHAGFTPRQTLAIIIVVGAMFHGLGIGLHFGGAPDWLQLIAFLLVCGFYYKAVIHAFKLSNIIQHFRGGRSPVRKGKLFTRRGHSRQKLAEHGMADHLTHQPDA
ncbi:undecaprenyl-phosphate alpha-N-acetylglucosaminyl 1-phosphate transferase [Endozoicomonas acroporae]|uniref:undecaprenyl-phosphate alpha-N-acetylglucosaminyl 1-phosphate transferase n=1 Tax=Endozoicomonas acroporae TaxID=1701104 RepID=UPI003D78C908